MLIRIKSPSISNPIPICFFPKKVSRRELNCFYSPYAADCDRVSAIGVCVCVCVCRVVRVDINNNSYGTIYVFIPQAGSEPGSSSAYLNLTHALNRSADTAGSNFILFLMFFFVVKVVLSFLFGCDGST